MSKKQKEFNSTIGELENIAVKVCKNGKTRSEIGKSSKRKGKSGERKIVNILKDISKDNWMRIPNSGAMIGKSNRYKAFECSIDQLTGLLGDIYCPMFYKHFWIIESKNYSSLSFKMLENGKPPSKLKGWIDEVNYDTETYLVYKEKRKNIDKDPISFLVVTISNKGTYIIYNKKYFDKIIDDLIYSPIYKFEHEVLLEGLINEGFEKYWYMEDFKKFIENNKKVLFNNESN